MSITSEITKTYTTHSGIDITALFDDMQLMTMQGIAISITREKAPIYTMGRARPVSISRVSVKASAMEWFMIIKVDKE